MKLTFNQLVKLIREANLEAVIAEGVLAERKIQMALAQRNRSQGG